MLRETLNSLCPGRLENGHLTLSPRVKTLVSMGGHRKTPEPVRATNEEVRPPGFISCFCEKVPELRRNSPAQQPGFFLFLPPLSFANAFSHLQVQQKRPGYICSWTSDKLISKPRWKALLA